MTQLIDIVGRLLARRAGHAICTRATSALAPDPTPVFGIAPIRLMGEQQVQAVAYGILGTSPDVAVRWNPLNRELDVLEPFAAALERYLTRMLDASQMPRVWLPHTAALDVLVLLGEHLRRNRHASPTMRQLGVQCAALAAEAAVPGQQIVAIGSALLKAHAVTGQTPVEDNHIGAFLAWLVPSAGTDAMAEADRRSLVPAAALLPKDDDERIEQLRGVAKTGGQLGAQARTIIEDLLACGARAEWALLEDVRMAFWEMGLPTLPVVEPLVDHSIARLVWALRHDARVPSRPRALIGHLHRLETAAALAENLDARGDALVRERLRLAGRVVRMRLLIVQQPRPGFHPCTLVLRTEQLVARLRSGAPFQTLDAQVQGIVEDVDEDQGGAQLVTLRLVKGVRQPEHLVVGHAEDWLDTVVRDTTIARQRMLAAMEQAQAPAVFAEHLPAPAPRTVPIADVYRVSEELRLHGT